RLRGSVVQDAGCQHSDRIALGQMEVSGEPVRSVAELLHRLLDPLPGLLVDVAPAGEVARHGLRRDAGQLADIDHPRSPPGVPGLRQTPRPSCRATARVSRRPNRAAGGTGESGYRLT